MGKRRNRIGFAETKVSHAPFADALPLIGGLRLAPSPPRQALIRKHPDRRQDTVAPRRPGYALSARNRSWASISIAQSAR